MRRPTSPARYHIKYLNKLVVSGNSVAIESPFRGRLHPKSNTATIQSPTSVLQCYTIFFTEGNSLLLLSVPLVVAAPTLAAASTSSKASGESMSFPAQPSLLRWHLRCTSRCPHLLLLLFRRVEDCLYWSPHSCCVSMKSVRFSCARVCSC